MHQVEMGITYDRGYANVHRNDGRTNLSDGIGMTVEIVAPDELEAEESTPGVVRETVFQAENNVVVRSSVAAGTTTGWHHHGERHVFGYFVEGSGAVEYGPSGGNRDEGSAGDFFFISPGTVHRDITTDEEAVVLVNFVGAGPVVVNVEGPDTE